MHKSFKGIIVTKNIANTRDLLELDRDDILSYWPFGEFPPRKSQELIQDWVQTLGPEIRYLICEIPVGGGKSPLAMNLSGWYSRSFGDAYLLTPQKILQKQYEESFEKHLLHTVYGKANYKCAPKDTNCDIGDDIKPRCEVCPHKDAIQRMAYSPNVVLNYALALNLFKYVAAKKNSPVRRRGLLVCDEAHTLENHLTEFNSISFSEMRCKKIGIPFRQHSNIASALEWIKFQYMPALKEKVNQMMGQCEHIIGEIEYSPRALTKDEERLLKDTKELGDHIESIEEQLLAKPIHELDERYVMVADSKTSFKFKELYGKHIFKALMEPMADRFLFMSATILDKDAYCSDLGIDPDKTAFISIPSEFPEENRPFIFMPTMNMKYGWDSDSVAQRNERKKMVNKITQLCKEIHPDDNGVIHSGNFQIAKWLVSELSGKIPHQIYHHNPDSGYKRDTVINEFQQDDGIPKLLISPSVTEGLDLKDSLGRFVIFAKTPFPNLGDAWVKRRMNLSGTWYSIQALIAIIQGGGRVVRSPDDWGHVYALDSGLAQLINRNKKILPAWWLEAYQEM